MVFEKITYETGGKRIEVSGNKLVVPDNPIIPFIEGDGIGPDIWNAARRVLDAAVEKAYGGKRKIMEMIAPIGPVYQAGTLSGNPLAMTAGIAMLQALSRPGVYQRLEEAASLLEAGIAKAGSTLNIKLNISRFGSLLTIFFTDNPVLDYESVSGADTALFGRFFQQLLSQGIYWPPSQFEAAFVSLAHSDEDIQNTIVVMEKALGSLQD